MNTLQQGQNTGVIITPPRESDLHVGALTPSVFNETSDWRQYECDGEWQKDMAIDWESEACMSFTGSNNVATYLNWLISTNQILPAQFAFLKNNDYMGADGKVALSPRFTATMSGTTVNGNDFQNVWDSLQIDGVVPDSLWPMPVAEMNANPANAWKLYYATPTTQAIALGKQFLTYFDIQWEWLVSNGQGATEAQFVEWLKTAPVHIAIAVCNNWNTDQPIAGCGTGAAHGVQLSRVEPNVVNNILDHYVPFDKQLETNYTLSYAVRGYVEQIPQIAPVQPVTPPVVVVTPNVARQITIMQELIVAYGELLKELGITPKILPSGSILSSMNTISPALLGFLRGLGMVVIIGLLTYIGDATHLPFLNPATASLVAVIALTLEHALSPAGTALMGAVRTA